MTNYWNGPGSSMDNETLTSGERKIFTWTTIVKDFLVDVPHLESILFVITHFCRRYFPAVMKDHQSHDVLLMCVRCHQKSNILDAGLRSRLAHECGAPIGKLGKG